MSVLDIFPSLLQIYQSGTVKCIQPGKLTAKIHNLVNFIRMFARHGLSENILYISYHKYRTISVLGYWIAVLFLNRSRAEILNILDKPECF